MATTRPIRAGRTFALAGRLVDLVLLGVISMGLTAVLFGRVLPAIGHPVFVVSGPSMVPALPVGAAVALDAADPATLEVGDVVSLRTGPDRSVFTHRIIRIVDREDGRWIETKGDANAHADPSLTPVSAVIGRVGLHVPSVGYLLTLVSTLPGLVLLLSTGLALMVLGWWLDDAAADRRRRAARASAASAAIPTVRVMGASFVPRVMPARAASAMHVPTRSRRTKQTKPAGAPTASVAPVAPAVAVARVPAPPGARGTVSAAELLRSDPNGRRRRRRAELARSRP